MNPDNVIFIVDVVERFAQVVVLVVAPIAVITFIRSLLSLPRHRSSKLETPTVAAQRPAPATTAPVTGSNTAVLEATL